MADLGGTFTAEQGLLAALAKPRAKTEKVELGQQNMQFSMTEKDELGNEVPMDLSKFRMPKRADKQLKRDAVKGETLALHHKDMRLGYTPPMDDFQKLKDKANDRRVRHDAAAKRFDGRLKEVSEELEERVLASGKAVQELLGEVDRDLAGVFAVLNNDDILREQPEHGFVLQQWELCAAQCARRTAAIELFRDDLEGLEVERGELVGAALRELADAMVAIAYALPPEIQRLVEVEVHALNLVLIGNRRAHADLTARLAKRDVAVYVDSRTAWLLREKAWRELRHERALRVFDDTINSRRFVNPQRRRDEFEALRASQRERHEETRMVLLRELAALDPEDGTLASAAARALLARFEALRDEETGATEAGFDKLRAALLASTEEAAAVREELRGELHVYAALAQEGDLTELSAPLLAQVADESLDEYWRMGGALKPTLQSIAALMASPRIIYAEELTELRSKIDLLVECLPLAELLEVQGKGGERAALVGTLEQVRKAAKADLPALLPLLKAQAAALSQVAGLPPLQAGALSGAADGLGAVLDEYEATQRAYEHTMKKQKAGKQTDFAASLGLDTTQINMAGVRHAQRELAMVVHATALRDGARVLPLLCIYLNLLPFYILKNAAVLRCCCFN